MSLFNTFTHEIGTLGFYVDFRWNDSRPENPPAHFTTSATSIEMMGALAEEYRLLAHKLHCPFDPEEIDATINYRIENNELYVTEGGEDLKYIPHTFWKGEEYNDGNRACTLYVILSLMQARARSLSIREALK